MLNKLTLRNAKRSIKDYMIYVVTMTIISALMFSFHGMMFSEDIKLICSEIGIFAVLVLLASFFIMMIIIWLVHYMVNFMMEKRSREFGTYLLLGMKKKQIARLFKRENLILGSISILFGILPGFLFQKLFTNIFYSILEVDYRMSIEFSLFGVLTTVGILTFSYILALTRVKKKFKKMQIRDLVYMDRQNEEIQNESKTWKKLFVFISVIYIIIFNVLVFIGAMTSVTVWGYLAGLIAAIYLLYAGLSSFFVNYIKKQHAGIYHGANLFIFRQLSSKIKTMRFTMGTLSILFTAALLGWTVVMMFGDYQKREIQNQMPFDIMLFSDQKDDTFDEQMQILKTDTKLKDYHNYQVYENGTNAVNDYLYDNIDGTWHNDIFIDGKVSSSSYFGYDTYMGISDYNYIRSMIGLEPAELKENHYILHGKLKIDDTLKEIAETIEVKTGGQLLACQTINMEPLAQSGMNGADYILVVPDSMLSRLRPYYSLLMAELAEPAPKDLQSKLEAVKDYFDERYYEDLYDIEYGTGSSQILSWGGNVGVADIQLVEGGFVIVAMCFVLAYLGIVFLCAALTILAVQQLSDSSKYQFRYTILKKLGMNKNETRKVILKQLAVYYLCPFAISIVLSIFIGMFISERFVYYTGINAGIFQYYFLAVLVFTVVYAAYFAVSYIGFQRNVENKT